MKNTARCPEVVHIPIEKVLWTDGTWLEAQLAALKQHEDLIYSGIKTACGRHPSEDSAFNCIRVAGIHGPFGSCAPSGTCIKSYSDKQCTEVLTPGIKQHANCISTKILPQLLQRCIDERDEEAGKEIHSYIVRNGLEADVFLGIHLIRMFASFQRLFEANYVFNKLPKENSISWNAIIVAHAKVGQHEQVLKLYQEMKDLAVEPDGHLFVAVLKSCAAAMDMPKGKLIHAHILEGGFERDIFVGNTLVDMYSKCGSVQEACTVFQNLPKIDVVTWNVLISQLTQDGNGEKAIDIYQQMKQTQVEPDRVTFICVLKACSSIEALEQGRIIHSYIVAQGISLEVSIGSSLIDMYGKCGSLKDARNEFDRLPKRNVAIWSTLIAGYAQHGQEKEALHLFQQMEEEGMEPDRITLVCTLKASSSIAASEQGKRIHTQILARGLEAATSVGSILIDMYCKCSRLHDAWMVFNRLPRKDVIAWSALIAGFVGHGRGQDAFQLFQQMQQEGIEPDQVTFVCILKSCSSIACLDQGQQIHAQIVGAGFELDFFVGNTLIDMYSKCGSLEDAHKVFGRLHVQDVVTWNALIAGYTNHEYGQYALSLFHQMHLEHMEPNVVTFVCILKACSSIADFEQGKQIHAYINGSGLESKSVISNALLDMYSKCGSLDDARRIFNRSPQRDVLAWNALIAGYVRHEQGAVALQLFQQMQQEGMEPDHITFVYALKVCSSLSALEQGKHIHSHNIESGFEMEIFIGNALICMYAGCKNIEEAQRVFDRMQMRDVISWSTLMTGYVQHGHLQEALQLFQNMQQEGVEPDQAAFVCIFKACSSLAALEQGKSLHAHALHKGFESDLYVSTTLIDMYGKCGSLEDAHTVFERLPKQNVVTWNAMIAAYVENTECRLAFQHFEDMKRAGLKPNDVTFICLLSACSHMGVSDEGISHFTSMRDDHGIIPGLKHYDCMVDILGHAGCLKEAQDLLDTIPFAPNLVGWTSLLSSCRAHGETRLAKECFDHVVNVDPRNAAVYVLMSNIYAYAGMHKDAEKVEELRKCQKLWKKPGKAFIEIGNQVHEFNAGDNSHPQSDKIYAKVKSLSMQMREKGYMPHLDLVLTSSNEDKEDVLCGHCEKLAIAFGLISTPMGTTIRVAKNLRVCHNCHVATKLTSQIEKREIILMDAYRIHHFKGGTCSCKDGY